MKVLSLTLATAILSVASLSIDQNVFNGDMKRFDLDSNISKTQAIYRRDGDHGGHGGSSGSSSEDAPPEEKKEHSHADMVTPAGWFEMFPQLKTLLGVLNLSGSA